MESEVDRMEWHVTEDYQVWSDGTARVFEYSPYEVHDNLVYNYVDWETPVDYDCIESVGPARVFGLSKTLDIKF